MLVSIALHSQYKKVGNGTKVTLELIKNKNKSYQVENRSHYLQLQFLSPLLKNWNSICGVCALENLFTSWKVFTKSMEELFEV